MTFTLRQVKTLLTSAELQLFEQSRRDAIAALSVRQLRAKLTRARALRDKYRDLYRRQTVDARKEAPATGAAARFGGQNERTSTKADVFAEVLTRFEQRLAKLGVQEDAAASSPGLPTGATRATKATKATKATQTTQTTKATKAANTTNATNATTASRASKPRAGSGSAETKASAAPRKAAARRPSGARKPAVRQINLLQAVEEALARKHATASNLPAGPRHHGDDVAIGAAGHALAHAHDNAAQPLAAAPTDAPALAERLNPLKAEPVNRKIHASARSRQQHFEAARDSR